MLRCITGLRGYVLAARDGEIGRCRDFLFDDQHWTIRFMVADTGKWLPGRKVLVSPMFLGEPDWSWNRFPVDLTRQQIDDSPPLDEHMPVSRRFERRYYDHYDIPIYWGGAAAWSAYPTTAGLLSDEGKQDNKPEDDDEDAHLQSADDVIGYHISARDGEIGHLDDLIVEAGSWTVRNIVVDTRNWLPGRRVMFSPDWVKEVDWSDRKLTVDRYTQEIRNCSDYDPAAPVNKEQEERFYDYLGRPRQWEVHK